MTSPSLRPCWSASDGWTHAVVSQVTLVIGLGSSCSQPLFAKRPSQTVGSGRKMISRPVWLLGTGDWLLLATGDWLPLATGNWPLTGAAPGAPAPVPGTYPSCSTCFHMLSALLNGAPVGSVTFQLPTCPDCARVQ